MFLLPSVVMLAIGATLHRKGSTRGRVEVPAYVVQFSNFRRPYAVVFDYQLPNGQWNRMKKHVSHMTIDSSAGSAVSALYEGRVIGSRFM